MKRYLLLVLAVLVFLGCSKEESENQAPMDSSSAEIKESSEQESAEKVPLEEVVPENVKLVEGQHIEQIKLEELLISTPGDRISTDAQIVLVFRKDVVPQYRVGSILSENPFTFSPKIEGVARWTNRHEIHFIPDNDLTPGIKYSGIVSGKTLVGATQSVEEL